MMQPQPRFAALAEHLKGAAERRAERVVGARVRRPPASSRS
eukprot:SAG31_NODE_31602_length_366_cov_0.775281_1_plen_40_part_10